MSKAKDELTKLIEEQPEDSSREEIIRELAFHAMVQRGLVDSDAGRVISNARWRDASAHGRNNLDRRSSAAAPELVRAAGNELRRIYCAGF
jgi:hypothetical protein